MIRLAFLALLLFGGSCERSITVLVEHGCDFEDLVIESGGVELARVAPGVAPKCIWIVESRIAALTSRCESGAAIPVPSGVFDPAVECIR